VVDLDVTSDEVVQDPGTNPPDRVSARTGRGFRLALVLLVVVAVVVRFVYIWFERRDAAVVADAFYYHEGANLLVDGRGFIHPFGAADGLTIEAADHPPLYMLYLAGWSLVGARSVGWHLVANALLGVVAVVIAAYVGRRVGGDRVGVVAAALVALSPNVWRYDGFLMSETGVVLAVLVIALLAYRYWEERTPWRLVAVAVGIGLGTLVRPELLLLSVFLVVPLVLLVRERTWLWRLGSLALAAGVVLGVLAPWLVYNNLRFEDPVFISRNLGGTLAVSYCDSVFDGPRIGHWDFNCGAEVVAAAGITGYDSRADAIMRDAGIEYALDNLDRLPAVVAARVGRITGVYQPAQQRDLDVFWQEASRPVATAGMIVLPFTLVGAVAGAVILRRRRVLVLPLLAPIACVLVTVVVFYAATRFRATAEGPICVLVAVALVALWDRVRHRVTPAGVEAGSGAPAEVQTSSDGHDEAGTVGPPSRQG
jgi:4-amino-4-deoxy-L-arabinose transferase-like glycosyltransferase